jgi:hypothetical protein
MFAQESPPNPGLDVMRRQVGPHLASQSGRQASADSCVDTAHEGGEACIQALGIDLVFDHLATLVPPAAIVRLGLTCRALYATLRALAVRIYSAFPPRHLGKQGFTAALTFRWRWHVVGASPAEVDEALIGAAQGRRIALARALLEAPASLSPAAPAPSGAAVDKAVVAFAENGLDCEDLAWLLNENPVRPSYVAVRDVVLVSCGRGKLGLAQIAWRLAITQICPNRQQDLLLAAIEATGGMICHSHVVKWATSQLLRLEQQHL